jgi:hypothetical protein
MREEKEARSQIIECANLGPQVFEMGTAWVLWRLGVVITTHMMLCTVAERGNVTKYIKDILTVNLENARVVKAQQSSAQYLRTATVQGRAARGPEIVLWDV